MSAAEALPRSEARTRGAQLVALAGAAVIGMRVDLPYGLTAGGLLALAILPLWLPTAVRNRWLLILAAAGAAAVTSGAVLMSVHAVDHIIIPADGLARSVTIVQLVLAVGVLLWCQRVTSVRATSLAFAAGLAIAVPLHISSDPNLWRFTLSIPVGILALVLVSSVDRLWLTLLAVGVLAALGLANDSRSNSAFLLLAAIVVVWQRVANSDSRRARGWGGLLSLLAAGGGLALLLQGAILDGAFGEATQVRTAEQIARGGNVIVGGRPEIAASLALIERHPAGLGPGAQASYEDVTAAKGGMLGVGYDPNNGYVERFMFGSGIELHSVLGDMWIWFGLGGVLLAGAIAVLVATGFARGYAAGSLSPIYVYLCIRGVWDLLFSPVDSSLRLWPLLLSLAIAYATSRLAPSAAGLSALGSAADASFRRPPRRNHSGAA